MLRRRLGHVLARFVVLPLAVTGMVAGAATQASACSCAGSTVRESVNRVDGVFLATVGPLVEDRQRTNVVEVTSVYKGDVGARVTINTGTEEPGVESSCDFELTEGTTRMFFATGGGSTWAAGQCNGPFGDETKIRHRLDQLLGQPTPPSVDAPVYEPPESEPQPHNDMPDAAPGNDETLETTVIAVAAGATIVVVVGFFVAVRRRNRLT